MTFRIIEADVFEAELLPKSFALVYADPPYANCRFKYARQNNSRQWGRNARADFLRDIIARMESLRAPSGVCAISMATPELELLSLFPSKRRVMAWTKPYAPMRPGVWPCYAWEPLVCWGRFPNREEQKTGKTPHDWLHLAPKRPKKSEGAHENPKPEEFGEWVLNVTLGPRAGDVCELYAGTAPIARAASARGMAAIGVDLKDWTRGAA